MFPCGYECRCGYGSGMAYEFGFGFGLGLRRLRIRGRLTVKIESIIYFLSVLIRQLRIDLAAPHWFGRLVIIRPSCFYSALEWFNTSILMRKFHFDSLFTYWHRNTTLDIANLIRQSCFNSALVWSDSTTLFQLGGFALITITDL